MKTGYQPKTRFVNQKQEIFDALRGRYVTLTPEESVRQHFVYQLIHHYNYPAGRIAIETSLKVNHMLKRSDIVVFSKTGQPWMLVECKAPEVKLTQKVFDQVNRYNYELKADYLVLTNGERIITGHLDYDQNQCKFQNSLPPYPSD
jgi:hypothetical protein